MITNKEQLNEYLSADAARYSRRSPFFWGYFYGDETFGTQLFLRRLRKTEYYYNSLSKKNPLKLIRFAWSFFLYRRFQLRYKIFIPLNVCASGLYIPHRFGGGNN